MDMIAHSGYKNNHLFYSKMFGRNKNSPYICTRNHDDGKGS